MRYTGKNRKSDSEEGKELLLCEVKTAIWCWDGNVKETMNWRYCWRAGVMSRNEGEEEEELLVWMVFFFAKAWSSPRVTVVREGKSACEDRVIGNTLQSDDTRIVECVTITPFSSEFSEFG